MKRIRVAHVFPILSLGGLWRHLQAAERLDPAIYSSVALEVFQLETPSSVAPIGSPLLGIGASPEGYRDRDALTRRVKEKLRSLRPDIVHSYHCLSDFYAIGAAAELGIPVVRTVAGISQMGWGGSFNARTARDDWNREEIEMQLALDRDVGITLAVSEQLKKRLCGYGFSPDKVRVSYLGTDVHPPEGQSRTKPYVRPRLRGDDASLAIGFMHRLEPVKLTPGLLPVLRNLTRSGVHVQMVLVAGGRLTDSFVYDLAGVDVDCTILPASPDLWSSVPPVDCVLLASQSEGVPLILLEAMVRGIPVIATSVGGVPEIVEHGATGYLYDRADSEALERILRLAATGRWDSELMCAAALRAVTARMDRAMHLRDLHEIYQSLAGGDRRTLDPGFRPQ